MAAGAEQHGPQGVAHRLDPLRWLDVTQLVLQGDGLTEFRHGLIDVTASQLDFAPQHVVGGLQCVPGRIDGQHGVRGDTVHGLLKCRVLLLGERNVALGGKRQAPAIRATLPW